MRTSGFAPVGGVLPSGERSLSGRRKAHPEHWFQGFPRPRSPRARWRPTVGRLEVRSSSHVLSELAPVLSARHSHIPLSPVSCLWRSGSSGKPDESFGANLAASLQCADAFVQSASVATVGRALVAAAAGGTHHVDMELAAFIQFTRPIIQQKIRTARLRA